MDTPIGYPMGSFDERDQLSPFDLPGFPPQHLKHPLTSRLPFPPSSLLENLLSSQLSTLQSPPPLKTLTELEAQLRATAELPSKLLKIRQAGALFLNLQLQRLQNLQIVTQFLRELEAKELALLQSMEAKQNPVSAPEKLQEGHLHQSTEIVQSPLSDIVIPKEDDEGFSPSSDDMKMEGGVVKCPRRNCGAHFATQTSVKKHLKRHLRPFPCPYPNCLKRFPESSTLKRHIRTHTGEKPFVCQYPECDKAFADRSNWRRHQHLHEEDSRPKSTEYVCPYALCKRSFSRLPNLRRHMKSLSHFTSDAIIKKEGDDEKKLTVSDPPKT